MTQRQERYAKRRGTPEQWGEAKQKQPPIFHVSGFDEPDLPVFTNEKPDEISFHHWPFVPFVYAPIINGRPMNTLNARDDKLLNSRVYKTSAEEKRCLVMIDGFFDHHTLPNKVKIPYYVTLKSGDPFCVAGLWQTYTNERDEISIDTVTMVTGPANKEMAWIHNEPAYSPESRMIYIIDPKDDDTWLHGSPEEAIALIEPLPDDSLAYHPCEPIKSNKKLKREYIGNVPEIQNKRYYPEVEETQGGLF